MQTISSISNPVGKTRIVSIDFLRGFIMIIMALDHVRDYFHYSSFQYNPLDLTKTSAPIFFTRWITHYCAPIFMMLAGTSAFLVGQRKGKKELAAFLLKRGIWLIVMEMIVVNFGWNFDMQFRSVLFITVWALGISMIALAALIYLPLKAIAAISIVMIAGHNLLDNIHVEGENAGAFVWALLHEQKAFHWHGETILVGYPVIPWIGIMALGYCLGSLYVSSFDAKKRKKLLLQIGFAAIGLFILLRFINIYGDKSHWEHQQTLLFTFLSFINVTKYPPSLLYSLMTLGPALIFLAYTENARGAVSKIISVYGRVPMFYYVLHIYLIHLLAMIGSELFTAYDWSKWILQEPLWFIQDFKGYGYSLAIVYPVWIAVVVVLYPLCKRYDAYKQAHKEKWWLSYL
jgi:uncharacterized membrane protein